jgi:Ca-activated chloride channel family protein
MRSRLLPSLSLLLLAGLPAGAQFAPADDFFNGGAQLYISNNIPAALDRVELGLKAYPDDVKLKKLEQLLKQQQQKQQQQNQQQQNQQNQQNQSQSQKSDQQKQDEQKQSQADQKKTEAQKQEEQKQAAAQKKNDQQPEKPDAENQPVKAGEMTPEDAKRLLDARKGDEQLLQMKPQEKPRDPSRPVKDW